MDYITNKILISVRISFLIVPQWSQSPLNDYGLLGAFLTRIQECGYTVSKELLVALIGMEQIEFLPFSKAVLEAIEDCSGMGNSWHAFYPNYPQEVMEMDEAQSFINSIYHYWTLNRPEQDTQKETLPLIGKLQELKVLNLGTYQDLADIFQLMMVSKSSLSKLQIAELKWFIENNTLVINKILPDKFNHQEIMAEVCSHLITIKHSQLSSPTITKYYNSATSVLRVIVGLNNGDVSLSGNCVFPKMNNPLVNQICKALEPLDNLDVDMLRHENKWKLLFKLMRAKQFSSKKYPKLVKAVEVVRGHQKAVTYNSLTEKYFAENKLSYLLNHLSKRPSMFARSLDRLLSSFNDSDKIIYEFREIASECSTLVLYQLIGFYRSRNTVSKRIFLPKGEKAQGYVTKNNLFQMEQILVDRIINKCLDALVDIYSSKLELGDVYVDPILKDYTIPLQLRSASKSFDTVGRGTRFKFDCDYIRLFMNWVNIEEDERTDLDLSAYFLDEEFNELESVAYYNQISKDFNSYHSGDLVTAPAPDGACEFIDLDIKTLLSKNVRYVAMCVHNFTNQSFAKFDTAFAGWMERDNINSGTIFEPRTVKHRYDLTAETTYSLPVVFDLVTKEAIWLDLSISSSPNFVNNLHFNKLTTGLLIEGIVNRQFPTMYDLLICHATARGVLVIDKEDADVVFDLNDDSMLKPNELEKILGEYL